MHARDHLQLEQMRAVLLEEHVPQDLDLAIIRPELQRGVEIRHGAGVVARLHQVDALPFELEGLHLLLGARHASYLWGRKLNVCIRFYDTLLKTTGIVSKLGVDLV